MIIVRDRNSSKIAVARQIFNEMATSKQTFTRQQVLERFQKEADLTVAGATTYYFIVSKQQQKTHRKVA